MKETAKPLRSMMYVPGNKEDWILKAPQYGADALIIDLEDSVPVSEKKNAREICDFRARIVPIIRGNHESRQVTQVNIILL